MKAWLDWFLNSQKGKQKNSWRWRGRSMEYLKNPFTGQKTEFTKELNPKTLASGLDDFPRASHPSSDERHVDLYCWMALATSVLTSVGRTLRLKAAKWVPIAQVARQLRNETILNSLHYDPASQQYLDWGNHTESVRLDTWYAEFGPQQGIQGAAPMQRPMGLARIVDKPPSLQFVPHYGYVSLFPLMMRLISPNSEQLSMQLHHLRQSGLMTGFGLRSLSTQSSLHGARNTEHDAPYWRGPIWMPVNYLVLSALKHYSEGSSEAAVQAGSLYQELKSNLLRLTVKGYQDSGYLWENYDENTGQGTGCRIFTGWTALMVLILADDS